MRDFSGSTVVEVGEGPEDVLVDASGRVCTGLADGRIVRLAGPGQAPETVARVPGRPLGLEFLGRDELVVCASDAGLLAVSLTTGTVRTLADEVAGRALRAVNNAAVATDGTVTPATRPSASRSRNGGRTSSSGPPAAGCSGALPTAE